MQSDCCMPRCFCYIRISCAFGDHLDVVFSSRVFFILYAYYLVLRSSGKAWQCLIYFMRWTENEKLRRSHHESWSKFVDEMTYHAKCQRLTEEIREANIKLLSLGAEHEKMIDMVKQECNQKIHDLEKQVSCSLDKQASDQVLINQFQRELVTHETHIDILTGNLEMVTSDLQSKYDAEILELKSQLLAEQNVKNDLQVKLQNTENELQIMKQKQEKQQRDSISLHHVETLKQKIMRLRKENESLKRQVAALNDHHI
ncbi:protein At-4/1-like isoform X1 [Zingiber officinale]|uniref:protein At-4/1-like isoform X1 n=1 Tax=Zingiber officinale TaxID=94328 RepID=UPI001C4B0B22|nr:protein At-4/1-like isoform X1 [Zingiber officinale]